MTHFTVMRNGRCWSGSRPGAPLRAHRAYMRAGDAPSLGHLHARLSLPADARIAIAPELDVRDGKASPHVVTTRAVTVRASVLPGRAARKARIALEP